MNIKIMQNSTRRCAFTDRKDGYIEMLCSKDMGNSGYYRGNRKFFTGFSVSGHAFNESKQIDVYPEGFVLDYENANLAASLLIDEQAFFVTGAKNWGIVGINSASEKKVSNSEDKGSYSDKPVEESKINYISKKKSENQIELPEPDTTISFDYDWKLIEKEGIQILTSGTGYAIAADFDFYFKSDDKNLEIYTHDTNLFDKKINTPFSDENQKGWYFIIEESEQMALEKAVRLVKENAVHVHIEKINTFLSKCSFSSGDKKFDESIQWARFSAWLLATKDHDSDYRGIWAGLPWFRDNWGRDTFISLCGTLLISGCFDEAKNVLLGFSGFQDLDKTSPSYGRIPNRYRNAQDVIYNTADGTLWFIRALWEYVQYSGDVEILNELSKTVEIALDADIARSDGNGFLKHGDADTWMDARIKGDQPWSPRGDRANDIQALWYTALKLGSRIMEKSGRSEKVKVYEEMAEKLKKSFEQFFWNEDCQALADHLPEGGYGEWAKDMRVRPNQLFVITVPEILSGDDKYFVKDEIREKILENVNRELVNPFGLYSLSPEDPIFHPEHENPTMHNKDAAYHNGTIWEWNSGAYISAEAENSAGILSSKAIGILQNEAKMILERGCAGSLSENIHARPDEDGNPKLSGTFSQAWSVAEYVRNIAQDVVGFVPHLIDNELTVKPCLPIDCKEWNVLLPFGKNWSLKLNIVRKGKNYNISAIWHGDIKEAPELKINGLNIRPESEINFTTPARENKKLSSKLLPHHVIERFGVPAKWVKEPYPVRNLSNEWCGSEHVENYLENVILSGRMKSKTSGGENTACLEWYFDSQSFKEKYITDEELGAIYTKNYTTFRLWAPTARNVSLVLYSKKNASEVEKILSMKKLEGKGFEGIWEVLVKGDLHGVYYEYKLLVHGVYNHCADPYAHACGVNGNLSMVVDMSRTNPDGWNQTSAPEVKSPSDVIAWEAHVADVTSSEFWNGPDDKKRLFTGVSVSGTNYKGFPTGFDYIKYLGVTHVQFLPIFDFRSVDESKACNEDYRKKPVFGAFNWGYDPENYGCPEGSYSSDPFNGEVRIKELKEMIMAFNKAGIGVIMDVVFNHVNDGLHQSLGISVPGYFFRVENYSGAGEDTASEREMFRKYMINTLSFWLKEYKLSGFRFDLMGLHDVDTMNEIEDALRKIKKDVLIYGEGWQMYNGGKMLPSSMCNAYKMPGIGHFNDAFRCAVKGTVFDDKSFGFIQDGSHRESVKFGITGATLHPQMDFSKVDGTANPNPWTQSTWTSVNYTEVHDNITLNDKIRLAEPGKSEEYYEQLAKLAISLVLLSEGMPILHAGMEFLRTKEIPEDILNSGATFYDVANSSDGKAYLRNSYNACDKINALDWKRAYEKQNLVEYVRKLIQLRKNHPAFRIASGKTLAEALEFLDNKKNLLPERLLVWKINGKVVKDNWKSILLCANPLEEDVPFALPEGDSWFLVTDGIDFSESENPIKTENSDGKVLLKAKGLAVFAAK